MEFDAERKDLIRHYREVFGRYGDSPEGVQYSGSEGQRFRFERITDVGDLRGRRVLDLGCGLGHLYPFILQKCGAVDYTGVDIVPETVAVAARRHPEARFLCRDVLVDPLAEEFDYVLLNGVFNNVSAGSAAYLEALTRAAYACCRGGLAFNFVSTYVNTTDPEMAYHDPVAVLGFCLTNLSRRVLLHHHYDRCDVVVFVYR